jgi:hypothetical protein
MTELLEVRQEVHRMLTEHRKPRSRKSVVLTMRRSARELKARHTSILPIVDPLDVLNRIEAYQA